MHKSHIKNVNHMHIESLEVSISFDTTIDQHLQPIAKKKKGSSKHSPFLVPIALAFAQPIACNNPMAPLVVTNDVEPKPLSCINVTP
jgi:hypothetical protein